MIIDPETGEVFEALDYPQLTLKARGALRRELKRLYLDRWECWWVPGMNNVDRHKLASELTQTLRMAALGSEALWGEIDEDAVFEEVEYFLPKLFLKYKLSGNAKKSPGAIRFNPYTHKIMCAWRYQSPIARLRHLQEHSSERERMELAKARRDARRAREEKKKEVNHA